MPVEASSRVMVTIKRNKAHPKMGRALQNIVFFCALSNREIGGGEECVCVCVCVCVCLREYCSLPNSRVQFRET